MAARPEPEGPAHVRRDDERNAAHRARMAPVYALHAKDVAIAEIAAALGMSETTLRGRIQLDKRYLGESSPFTRP